MQMNEIALGIEQEMSDEGYFDCLRMPVQLFFWQIPICNTCK